jgi:hypothetical protein
MTMVVDETGWDEATAVLEEAMAQLQVVHERSRERLQQNGGRATPMITGLAAFEPAEPSDQRATSPAEDDE